MEEKVEEEVEEEVEEKQRDILPNLILKRVSKRKTPFDCGSEERWPSIHSLRGAVDSDWP